MTWDRWESLTTGRKWKYLDHVLRLSGHGGGARESDALRMEISIMEAERGENEKPESSADGSQSGDLPWGKGAARKPSPPFPPSTLPTGERGWATPERKEENERRQRGEQ